MTRITTAIFAIFLISCFGCTCKSPLVLKNDIWVMARNEGNYSIRDKIKKKHGALSIEFLTDGKFIGILCNNSFSGRYTTQNNETTDSLNIIVGKTDPTLCEDNPENFKYVEIFRQVRSYTIKDERLELMDSIGKVTISFIPASVTQKNNNTIKI